MASVVGLRVDGVRDSGTIKEVFGIHAKGWGLTWEQFHDVVAGKKHRWRLAEMANAAAFKASGAQSAHDGNGRESENRGARRLTLFQPSNCRASELETR